MTNQIRTFILEQMTRFEHLEEDDAIEAAARFFRDSLHIGSIGFCRSTIREALQRRAGDKVMKDGFPGTITKVCTGQLDGMFEVRLASGMVCVDESGLR